MGQRRQGEKSSTEGGVGRVWQTFGSGSVFASNKYAGCERTSEFGCFSIRAIHDAGQQLPLISLLPAAKLVARGRPRRRSQFFFSHTMNASRCGHARFRQRGKLASIDSSLKAALLNYLTSW